MVYLYNTINRKIEEFIPIDPENVKMYACGPTVYDFQHIGHMRRYVGDDILLRVLEQNGYKVKHVMNITDVGHLTSDADTGEDKMEKGAKKHGLSVWDLAKKFEDQFFFSVDKLNIKRPDVLMHATDYIEDQIELVKELENKGYTYKTSDGIYFDTSKFKDYSKLSGQEGKEKKAGARVELVKGKKNPTDFALWKFSPNPKIGGEKRQMEWDSSWGVGFPGWHIECSAMSMVALGPTLDIHTGGIDHIPVHHTNEIAQSEAATERQFVKYWVHHAFLLVEGEKMSKSLGNIYTVDDVINKGFSPMALRYLYLQTHYRHEMNFTWEALKSAQNALDRLYEIALELPEEGELNNEYANKFFESVTYDLDIPKAISVMWDLLRSKTPVSSKAATLFEMDKVFGLKIKEIVNSHKNTPEQILQMSKDRERLRKEKRFHLADQLRSKIEKQGYIIKDTKKGSKVLKKV